MRYDCYEEEGDAEYYDGAGYEVVEAGECSDDDFLGSFEVGFLGYWVFYVEGDVEQVPDLARVSAAEESSDEALDENEGETPEIYSEIVVLDGH